MLSKIAQIQQIIVTLRASSQIQQVFIQQVTRKNVGPQVQESDIEQSAFLQASPRVAFALPLPLPLPPQPLHQQLIAL